MNCNVGSIDRRLRIILGVMMIAVGGYFQNWWGAVGLLPLVTGLIGWCPAYRIFGMNTAKDNHHDKESNSTQD